MGKLKLAPHDKINKMRRVQIAGVGGCTEYAADTGDIVHDEERMDVTAAYVVYRIELLAICTSLSRG